MLYAIVADDLENTLEARMNARAAHLARLEELKSQGRLVLAGALPAIDLDDPGPAGFTGSLIVAEFTSLTDAEAWAAADPFAATGVYKSVTVKPFSKVLP